VARENAGDLPEHPHYGSEGGVAQPHFGATELMAIPAGRGRCSIRSALPQKRIALHARQNTGGDDETFEPILSVRPGKEHQPPPEDQTLQAGRPVARWARWRGGPVSAATPHCVRFPAVRRSKVPGVVCAGGQ